MVVTPGPLQLASLLYNQDLLLDVAILQVLGGDVNGSGAMPSSLNCMLSAIQAKESSS